MGLFFEFTNVISSKITKGVVRVKKKLILTGMLSFLVLAGSVWGQAQLPVQTSVSAPDLSASDNAPTVPQQTSQEKKDPSKALQAKPKTEKTVQTPAVQKPNELTETKKSSSSSRSQGSLKVTGSQDFSANVDKALDLLNDKAPLYARKVKAYLTEIRESDHSGVIVQTGVFHLGKNTVKAQDTYWLASVIVHDAYHAELYQKGQEYTGKIGEARCIEVQKEALLEMGAPDHYQTHLDQILQSNYWDVPFDQRKW